MGLAALFAGILIALAIAVIIVYGSVLGLIRAGRFLWRFLIPEERDLEDTEMSEAPTESPCWEENNCPPSARDKCSAYVRRNDGLPCWLANLQADGRMRASCLTCKRFDLKVLAA